MPFPNPFLHQDESTRNAWGYVFQWTGDHQTPEQYNHLKYSYDTLAEECVNVLNEHYPGPPPSAVPQVQEDGDLKTQAPDGEKKSPASSPGPKRDLFALLRDHRHEHQKLQQLWDEVTTIPDWVD